MAPSTIRLDDGVPSASRYSCQLGSRRNFTHVPWLRGAAEGATEVLNLHGVDGHGAGDGHGMEGHGRSIASDNGMGTAREAKGGDRMDGVTIRNVRN